MGIRNKRGMAGGAASRPAARGIATGDRGRGNDAVALAAVGPNRTPEKNETNRPSNGLKEFMWSLDGLGRGTLLDLGPAWQTTLNFFIERGFRVSSEDILRGWKGFLDEEEARLRADGALRESLDATPSGRA